MRLQRIYDNEAPRDDWKPVTRVDAATWPDGSPVTDAEGKPVTRKVTYHVPPFKGIEVLHAGPRQKFSTGLVVSAVTEGWMTLAAGRIVLRSVDGQEVAYRIEHVPGRYCCHCNEKLQDDVTGELARLHVATQHSGQTSPHTNHPAGYGMTNAYECVKEG